MSTHTGITGEHVILSLSLSVSLRVHRNKHKCKATASRYIHVKYNVKLEKRVILIPVTNKLHARNRVESIRKLRRRLFFNSNAMFPCRKDLWISQYIGSYMFLALFSCNFIPTSLVLFHYRVKVDKFAIYNPITFIANDHDLEKSSNEIYSNTFFRIKEATYIYFSICNRKYIPSF